MFSKLLELTGLGLIAWGLALYLSAPAGIIFAGASMVLIGSVTDDESVGLALRRGTGWMRYAWHRQILRENGIQVPNLRSTRLPTGWVVCSCGGDEDCPLCEGFGFVPDPNYRANPHSPHPKIKVDPQTEILAESLARQRAERSKLRDLTPALSRSDYDGLEQSE